MAAVSQPFIVDTETSRPPNLAVYDDASGMGPVLGEMQCREAQRAERLDTHTRSAQRRHTFGGDIRCSEPVVENEDPNPGRGTIEQDGVQRIRRLTGAWVVQLQRDRSRRRWRSFHSRS